MICRGKRKTGPFALIEQPIQKNKSIVGNLYSIVCESMRRLYDTGVSNRLRDVGDERQRRPTGEARFPAECFLDAQAFVPFGHPLGSRERADLQLPGVPADRQMGDRHVLAFAGAGGNDGRETGRLPASSAAWVSVIVPAWLGLIEHGVDAPVARGRARRDRRW